MKVSLADWITDVSWCQLLEVENKSPVPSVIVCLLYFTLGGAPPAVTVVKTLPAPPEPVQDSHTKTTPTVVSTPPKDAASSAPPPASATKIEIGHTSQTSPTFTPIPNPPLASVGATAEAPQKTSSSLPSSPTTKAPPPFVLPKPQSPVNVVSPMTQTPPVSPPPPLVTPPPTPTKPSVASVPTYIPAPTVTAHVAQTPVSFTPQVLQASSLSPFGDGATTPTRGTPSGRTTPSTALRQGIPQKPYTFLDEKAR